MVRTCVFGGKWAPLVLSTVNTIDPAISSKTRDLEISDIFPYAIFPLQQTNIIGNPADQIKYGPGLPCHEHIIGPSISPQCEQDLAKSDRGVGNAVIKLVSHVQWFEESGVQHGEKERIR